jgi:hypothetical protein
LPTYRVFGTKYVNYYTIVSAADEYEAAQIANESHEWFEIPTDDQIEATDVYLNEDISEDLQLNIEADLFTIS